MKIILTMKTPDATYYAIQDVAEEYKEELENQGMDTECVDIEDELESFLSRWIKSGEKVTLEFDTVDKSARVVEA